jgi:uncharacterized linocin/CFP29 family protein
MFVDFVLNGQAFGPVGEGLAGMRFDPGLLRPYINNKGVRCVSANTGRFRRDDKGRQVAVYQEMPIEVMHRRGIFHPAWNATALRKDEWIEFDRVVIQAARQRLTGWTGLMAKSNYGGFNGMAKMTLEYEASSDPGEAIVDMDGISPGRNDSPLFKTRSMPLPITHSDFWFSARRLAQTRAGGSPLDTSMAEAAGRRVAEMIEKTYIGVEPGIQAGTVSDRHEGVSKVYGLTTFPYRIIKADLTVPTGLNPEAIAQDVIEMREALYAAGFMGPFVLYHTPAYDQWLDSDYFRTGGTAAHLTVRDRIKVIAGVQDVQRLDYWTGGTYQMVMVQMTSDVVRAINGMDLTTVQWEEKGGMQINFKVMAIQVPQFRFDYNGEAGILHATTP